MTFAGVDQTSGLRAVAFGAAMAVFTLSAALFVSPRGKELAMPGPLASVHGPLSDRCEACHPGGTESIKGLLHGLDASTQAHTQSRKCLECHSPGDDPFGAHGWASGAGFDLAVARAARVPGAELGQFECATCHHEHRGGDGLVTRLGRDTCQSCHQDRFTSLADGHPELGDYGTGRTSIRFDHARHFERHFAESEDAPTACTDCHVVEASGERVLVREFAAACGACHADEITGAAQIDGAGLVFLSLPAVDTLTLDDEGWGIGAWPADSGIVETPFGPFEELLLGDDFDADAARDALDLLDASPDTLEATHDLVWRLKERLAELVAGGHDALRRRLEGSLGRELGRDEAARLAAHLPAEVLESALADWMPALAHELERRRAGEPVPLPDEPGEGDIALDPRREAWVSSGGWYRQEADYSIRYRPAGHADPFLRGWIDATSDAAGSSSAGRVFAALTARDAVGSCAKCHELDAPIRWNASVAPRRGLTHFSHAPHLVGPDDDGCLSCHRVDSAEERAVGSSMLALEREQCASCHDSGRASDECLTCHAYHERSAPRPLPRAPLFRR